MNVTHDKSIKFVQTKLEKIIKVIFVPHPIDIGKFAVRMLANDIDIFRKDLNFDFDDYVVYPGQQPRYTGDIELYKNNKLVKKISVKTAVSGNLGPTLTKLLSDLDEQTDGLILSVFTCTDLETKEYKAILILIYIPYECVNYYNGDIYYTIRNKLNEKALRENCTDFQPLAINEAIQFEYLWHALILNEKVDESLKISREASEKAEKAYEKADSASEKAAEASEKAAEASEKAAEASEKAAEASEKADKILKELLGIKNMLKSMIKK